MKRTFLQFSAAVLVAACLFSCQKEMSVKADAQVSNSLSETGSSTLELPCGGFRTQTQGGWGSTPSGNNPGSYLHANFSTAFPKGLTVGCAPGNYYLKLTSAQAVTNLLPVGGKASLLTANVTDPASLKNVLVGQLVALKLSVGFDYYDADFGTSPLLLGDLVIGSGPFAGYSVFQFLRAAELTLGGCNSDFTPQQINETASSINENFVDGKTNNGFLVCPEDDNEQLSQ
jgi:hypothetical protein